jgi:cytoskeletal protein CcmA (bactofilin family)
VWFTRKRQPPIRSLVCESSVQPGELRFVDLLRIDGEVHGHDLAVGGGSALLANNEKAPVDGRVKAGHVIISVPGPIHGDGLLELQPGISFVGDFCMACWKCTTVPEPTANCDP